MMPNVAKANYSYRASQNASDEKRGHNNYTADVTVKAARALADRQEKASRYSVGNATLCCISKVFVGVSVSQG